MGNVIYTINNLPLPNVNVYKFVIIIKTKPDIFLKFITKNNVRCTIAVILG